MGGLIDAAPPTTPIAINGMNSGFIFAKKMGE
jgi:hypothetical protein